MRCPGVVGVGVGCQHLASTVPIEESVPGPNGIDLFNDTEGIAVLGSVVMIRLDDDGVTGPELWRTDGTILGANDGSGAEL